MDLFGILIWLVVLFSLVFFIIALVKGYKGWGVWHTILLAILFIESWSFLFFTAGVASRRLEFAKRRSDAEKRVDNLEKQYTLELIGDRTDPALDLQKFMPLTNELNRIEAERGRVWRNSAVESATPGGIALRLVLPVPQAPAPVPNPNNQGNNPIPAPAPTQDAGLNKGDIVYAFGESNSPNGRIPSFYFGEYVITESAAGAIKMTPTAPLSQEQINTINGGSFATWAIYELVPLDSHTAFANAEAKADENAIFGPMDPKAISDLLGIDLALRDAVPSSLSIADGIKASVLQSYLRDGGQAPDGTPAEALGKRVEFLVDHTIGDVDSEENRMATEGGFFDLRGRSVDARLKRGAEEGAGVFKAGSSYVFDVVTADALIEQKVAKYIAPVYIRPLNDYEYAFREVHRRTVASQQESLLISREIAEVNRSISVGEAQILARQDERKKLDKDVAQYQKERDVIAAETARLTDEVEAARKQLTNLYAAMNSLHDKLVKTQLTLAESIEASTRPDAK